MRKLFKLVTVAAFFIRSAVAEEAEVADPEPLFSSGNFKVYNLTEEYVLSEDQYYWKNVDQDVNITSILSNKTVIEFGSSDGIKNENSETQDIPIKSKFEFWSKKSMRNVTNLSNKKIIDTNEFFELHAQLSLENVDITDWTSTTLL